MPHYSQATHPALAVCFGEHVYPAADRLMPDHALAVCFGEHVHPAADRFMPDHALASEPEIRS
jgi:hypothetical protein